MKRLGLRRREECTVVAWVASRGPECPECGALGERKPGPPSDRAAGTEAYLYEHPKPLDEQPAQGAI